MNASIDTTKDYECADCGSYAIMHTNPALWPGLWECTNEECGVCDYCEHTGEREVTETYLGDSVSGHIYICLDCEQEIPLDQADPDEDAYDFAVDQQIDMARGK